MGVKVNVHFKIGTLVYNVFLGGKDRWMLVLCGLFVATIKVDSKCVESPIASRHTVWIQHRYNLPHIVVHQQLALIPTEIC